MKRLFTKIAKWLGFFKTPTVTKVEQKKVDIFKGRTKEWDSEVIVKTKRLPKDANDIQKLDRVSFNVNCNKMLADFDRNNIAKSMINYLSS